MVFYDDFLTGCKNTLFSFLSDRTCVIFHKFATEILQKITAMNRNIIRSLIAVFIASAFIVSCDPLGPSTYTENFFRIASVKCTNGEASLLLDYTGEKFILDNFKTQADMEGFKLQNGDRIIANLQLYAEGSMANNTLTLLSAEKYPTYKLAQTRPADTLNHDCQFNVLRLVDQKYPAIWAQGHLVNIAPIYYVPSDESVTEFYLYPLQMNNDTLEMRLYSYIPDNNLAIRGYSGAAQTWLCYDIASIREQVTDTAEQRHRNEILKNIEDLDRDSIMIHIFQPDTLCGKLDSIYYERYPRVTVSIKIPFDF